MLPPECIGRIFVAFDDIRLVANAGLLFPVTLVHHLGLGELVDQDVVLRYCNLRRLATLQSRSAARRATTPADATWNHDDHEHRTGSL